MSRNKIPILQEEITGMHLDKLIQKAIVMGASESAIIDSQNISVEDNLANYCIEPKCVYYGLSPSCPPHVSGPTEFRTLKKTHTHAVVVRIIVPSAALFSDERRDIMRLLHEIAASVEKEAVRMGYTDSKAFAGGSCKIIFCYNHLECRRLSKNGKCRNPQNARPSMSGFGINVSNLIKKCGWPVNINGREAESDAEKMSWVAGLIMLG
ncbi:MAG: DUF2284 domain-containing protein [Deltaproteobacteria bacterium]|nr:DUF2284 domain-containing protein [Deltaproteobacteria bacterium]